MVKKYFQFIAFFISLLVSTFSYSQTIEPKAPTYGDIEGLTMYPNPVSNGKLYISSLKNLSKDIEIFDVLGKKVLSSPLFGNTLDISVLNSGVYIIKIAEDRNFETRKLVVK